MRATRPAMVTIQLELIDADPSHADPALVGEVARAVFEDVRRAGYPIQPAYTGERGGDVFEILQQIGQNAIDHKEFLIALFTFGAPIAGILKERLSRQTAQDAPTQHEASPAQPIKLTYTLDGTSISVEAPDVASAADLAERFLAVHPTTAAHVSARSTMKITGVVPRKQSRRQRRNG